MISVAILIVTPFQSAFWLLYIVGGLSDVFDGIIAKKYNQQSDVGAMIDSIADAAFTVAILILLVKEVPLPTWLIVCGSTVMLLKIVGYSIGYYKFRTFASIHTWMNKLAGVLLFLLPVIFSLIGLAVAGGIVCGVALAAAVEEIIIIVKSDKLDRNCESHFIKRTPHISA